MSSATTVRGANTASSAFFAAASAAAAPEAQRPGMQ